MELLMKFYAINHSHYHHLVLLTKRAINTLWIPLGDGNSLMVSLF